MIEGRKVGEREVQRTAQDETDGGPGEAHRDAAAGRETTAGAPGGSPAQHQEVHLGIEAEATPHQRVPHLVDQHREEHDRHPDHQGL